MVLGLGYLCEELGTVARINAALNCACRKLVSPVTACIFSCISKHVLSGSDAASSSACKSPWVFCRKLLAAVGIHVQVMKVQLPISAMVQHEQFKAFRHSTAADAAASSSTNRLQQQQQQPLAGLGPLPHLPAPQIAAAATPATAAQRAGSSGAAAAAGVGPGDALMPRLRLRLPGLTSLCLQHNCILQVREPLSGAAAARQPH